MPNPTQIAELLQRGIAAARAGRLQEARQALLQVIELDERNERAWIWLSGVVDSTEERRICLENVLAINPQNHHAQAGMRWLDQQESPPPPAQERCPRCQSAIPPSGTTCPHCGQALIVTCPECQNYVDVQEAVCPECGEPLGDFRDGARYHLALAQAHLEHQQYRWVEAAIAHTEAESDGDPEVLEETAAVYERMGYTDQAIAAYKRAIERAPDSASAYARMGAIYRQRAMPAEARAMYEQAAELDGDDPAILFELAQLCIEEEGKPSKVLRLLERVVQLDPEQAPAHVLLGDVYLRKEQGLRAIEHYQRARDLTASSSLLGREARHKLARLQPSTPERQTQGWAETMRRVGGLMLSPALAALINARLAPWEISLAAWFLLAAASAGAYLWTCATDTPRNPWMRAAFGEAGVKGAQRKILVGMSGVFLWAGAFGLILWKV